jgi:hypothetical protein
MLGADAKEGSPKVAYRYGPKEMKVRNKKKGRATVYQKHKS